MDMKQYVEPKIQCFQMMETDVIATSSKEQLYELDWERDGLPV